MLTVRLSAHVQKELDELCERKNCTKSDIVKQAVEDYLQKERSASAYELGKDLFGQEGSGVKEASVNYKKRLKQKLNEKHSH